MSHDIGDRIQHAGDITHHFVISKANDFKSLITKKRLAHKIVRRLAIVAMAIKFNDQSCFQTGKVANVVPNGVLSSEMNIGELSSL